jgi:hypothetical protein
VASLTAPIVLRERSRFIAVAATAPAVLLLAHLLPASGPGLALRLAGAAACVLLLPGALVLRAVSWPSSPGVAIAASFALSLAVVAVALALVFLVGTSIVLAMGVIVIVSVCGAVPAALRGEAKPLERAERQAVAAVLAVAVPFAGVVWWSSGAISGDGFFHLARARKLAELDTLSTLTSVVEFKDGGLHAGYAFPLWQAVDALVARFAGVDVADVLVYLPAILVPLALLLAYGAGSAVFGSWAGGLALVAAQAAHFGFYWRGGNLSGTGFFENLAQPQAASHLLLTTAALALVFAFVTDGGWILLTAVGAAALALTAVHPTYTPFVALLLGGFIAARALLVHGWEPLLTRATLAGGVILIPVAAYAIAFRSAVRETSSWTPSAGVRAHELVHYGNAFTTYGDWFSLSPSAISRSGAVVVAGLLAVPLAGLAARRLWAALVLGGSLAILTVVLVPPLFTAFSDAFSISQSRRLPQFLPLVFAVAGGCIVLSRLRALGVGLAGGAGLALVLLYPGEFTYVYEGGGPGWAVWAAVAGGLVALAAGVLLRPDGPSPNVWAVAAAVAFVLPVAVAGFSGLERPGPRSKLTPGLVTALRAETAPGDVVFSDRKTAYVLAGFAPVYINASSPGHVAESPKNHPKKRAAAAWRFFYSRSATDGNRRAILDRSQADWVLVDEQRPHPASFLRELRLVYQDGRYALYEVGS